MSQENVEVIRRCLQLVQRGQVRELLDYAYGLSDANVEIRSVGRLPDQEPVRGREAGRAWLANLLQGEAFDFEIDPEEFIDAGDAVVVPTRQTAVGKASGARATNRLVYVYGFREGKIAYFDAFDTKAKALEAVGMRE
jgi:ketosteroid isomerase-like protein